MTGTEIATVICRELRAVERELNAYQSDEQVWLVPDALPNSGGTLALHIAGNLRHFIGAVLGGDTYVRDRDAEFAKRGVSRAELIAEVRAADKVVRETLARLDPSKFNEPYPQPLLNRRLNTGDFMLHLATHLAYHTGQLDFHRRVVTGDRAGVGAVSPAELASAQPIEG
jgi:hypothetical protein